MSVGLYLARVTEVLPALSGVRVQFEDMVISGFAAYDFVRVLQPRMTPAGGAMLWLPEVGELGVVGVMNGGYYVWLGSMPFLDKNQVDPTPGVMYLRHQSGSQVQFRANGDMELLHSSGTRLTISKTDGPLPALKATSSPKPSGDTSAPVVALAHSSGAAVKIDGGGNGSLSGFKSIKFQDGSNMFAMETLVDWINQTLVTWLKSHTHLCAAPGSPSGPPVQIAVLKNATKAETCSPSTFTGPAGS